MEESICRREGVRSRLRSVGVWAYCLSLAGCCTTPVTAPPPVIIPLSLTAPCEHEAAPETNGELLDSYMDAVTTIRECNTRISAIKQLVQDAGKD